MCFKLLDEVEYVENPDFAEVISAFASPDADAAFGLTKIDIAAKIYLHIAIVNAAIAEAEKYDQVQILEGFDTFKEVWDRSVVLCSTREAMFLNPEIVHPDQVFSDSHIGLTDKAIVLQLKDFSFVAQYSLTTCCTAPGESGAFMHRGQKLVAAQELRIKLNLASEQGIVYRRKAQ